MVATTDAVEGSVSMIAFKDAELREIKKKRVGWGIVLATIPNVTTMLESVVPKETTCEGKVKLAPGLAIEIVTDAVVPGVKYCRTIVTDTKPEVPFSAPDRTEDAASMEKTPEVYPNGGTETTIEAALDATMAPPMPAKILIVRLVRVVGKLLKTGTSVSTAEDWPLPNEMDPETAVK